MLKATGEERVEPLRKLAEAVFSSGMIPVDWEESFILNLYKAKDVALDHDNYRGLKLTDQVIKLLERVLDSSIRQMVSVEEKQLAFLPGRGTTDAIFIVRQLQKKYIAAANMRLYFAFIYLEETFDRVPRKVLWGALRGLGVDKWVVRVIQGMYHNARRRVRVNAQYNEEFGVEVDMVCIRALSLALCSLSWCWRPSAHRRHPGMHLQSQGMEG